MKPSSPVRECGRSFKHPHRVSVKRMFRAIPDLTPGRALLPVRDPRRTVDASDSGGS